jgi:hypothetical protein
LTYDQQIRRRRRLLGFALFAAFILLEGFGFAQFRGKPKNPKRPLPGTGEEITLRGCLDARPGRYYSLVADHGGWYYYLKGNTSILDKYNGKEISVRGREEYDSFPHSFSVTTLDGVFKDACPLFKPSFSHAAWHAKENRKNGISFAFPDDLEQTSLPESGPLRGNFVTDQKFVIAYLTIPAELYPNSVFGGGFFAIFVDPEISNSASCRQFGFSDPQFASSHIIGGIQYSEAQTDGLAGPRSSASRYFHTLQNGLCYELNFEFWEANPGNIEHKIRVLREKDRMNLMQTLISRVSYFRPAHLLVRRRNPRTVPQVTEFSASAQTADDATNHGEITLTWATQNADYVELSFLCPPSPSPKSPPGVVILEDQGFPVGCDNASPPFKSTVVRNRAPSGSQAVIFGNHGRIDPITVVIKMTPFSYAKAYPSSSKSILIQVDPYNPFPDGVPSADGQVLLSYPVSADGTSELQQGSSLIIHWRDVLPRDPCVNLYLVQDDGRGGEGYRLQLGGKCFTPESGGSCTWTIPDRYSGPGYRIFARSPGGAASGLGPPFSIDPANATH